MKELKIKNNAELTARRAESEDNMTREKLIAKYEDMMYKFEEYDIWEDDIVPKISNMTYDQIYKAYKADKKYYEEREAAGGFFG